MKNVYDSLESFHLNKYVTRSAHSVLKNNHSADTCLNIFCASEWFLMIWGSEDK